MARRKHHLIKLSPEEIVGRGILRRVTAMGKATKNYAFQYVVKNPKWAGWLAYMIEKLEAVKRELPSLSWIDRVRVVDETIKKAKAEWDQLPEEKKMEYIARSSEILSGYEAIAKKLIEQAKRINEMVESTEKLAEQIAAALA